MADTKGKDIRLVITKEVPRSEQQTHQSSGDQIRRCIKFHSLEGGQKQQICSKRKHCAGKKKLKRVVIEATVWVCVWIVLAVFGYVFMHSTREKNCFCHYSAYFFFCTIFVKRKNKVFVSGWIVKETEKEAQKKEERDEDGNILFKDW